MPRSVFPPSGVHSTACHSPEAVWLLPTIVDTAAEALWPPEVAEIRYRDGGIALEEGGVGSRPLPDRWSGQGCKWSVGAVDEQNEEKTDTQGNAETRHSPTPGLKRLPNDYRAIASVTQRPRHRKGVLRRRRLGSHSRVIAESFALTPALTCGYARDPALFA